MIESSVQGHAVPRFSIFKPYSTEKVDTLKHCFLKSAEFTRDNLPATILADDGLVYTVAYDSRIPKDAQRIPVVISFQQHTYGRFAVVRIKNELKRRKF